MRGRGWTGGAPQPILLTEIMAYGALVQLERIEIEELLGFVRLLDDVYFKHLEEKQKAKNHGGTRSNHRRTRGVNRG